MPDGYVLDVWMLISNILDCVPQSVRETLLVGFKIGPASVELMLTLSVLISLVNVQNVVNLLREPTRDCQLSSIIRFVTNFHKPRCKYK